MNKLTLCAPYRLVTFVTDLADRMQLEPLRGGDLRLAGSGAYSDEQCTAPGAGVGYEIDFERCATGGIAIVGQIRLYGSGVELGHVHVDLGC